MCAYISVCVCVYMRGDEKEENRQHGAVGDYCEKNGGNNHQRKPNGIPLLKHTNDLVLTAGLHICLQSHMPGEQMLLLPWLVVIVLCVALGLGKRKVGLFVHVVWLQGSDCTCETDTAIKLWSNILWIAGFSVPQCFCLCALLFLAILSLWRGWIIGFPAFLYLVASKQPKWVIQGWVSTYYLFIYLYRLLLQI